MLDVGGGYMAQSCTDKMAASGGLAQESTEPSSQWGQRSVSSEWRAREGRRKDTSYTPSKAFPISSGVPPPQASPDKLTLPSPALAPGWVRCSRADGPGLGLVMLTAEAREGRDGGHCLLSPAHHWPGHLTRVL